MAVDRGRFFSRSSPDTALVARGVRSLWYLGDNVIELWPAPVWRFPWRPYPTWSRFQSRVPGALDPPSVRSPGLAPRLTKNPQPPARPTGQVGPSDPARAARTERRPYGAARRPASNSPASSWSLGMRWPILRTVRSGCSSSGRASGRSCRSTSSVYDERSDRRSGRLTADRGYEDDIAFIEPCWSGASGGLNPAGECSPGAPSLCKLPTAPPHSQPESRSSQTYS